MLASHISATRSAEEKECLPRFSVGGLSHPDEEKNRNFFRWKEENLQIGDKVEIEDARTEEITEAVKIFRSNSDVQENPFTEDEMKEMRCQDYLELKRSLNPVTPNLWDSELRLTHIN